MDFLKQAIKEAIQKSLREAGKQGGVTLLEEIAESFTVVQLDIFINILQRVRNKKKNVVDA